MTPNPIWPGFRRLGGIALGLLAGCSTPSAIWTGADERGTEVTAVYARAWNGYVRDRAADGSFLPETFVLKDGGNFGGPRADPSIDRVSFNDVAQVITQVLAAQHYVASQDPATTDLAILVYWGTTIVPDDVNPRNHRSAVSLIGQAEVAAGGLPGANPVEVAEKQRQVAQEAMTAHLQSNLNAAVDARSANLLGYTEEIQRTSPHDPKMARLRDEVEQNRYYVVLLAYNFRVTFIQPQPKLLWEARFSIPERGNDFAKALPMMASIAARYFGQDSEGLAHHSLREGHVEVGDLKSLGPAP